MNDSARKIDLFLEEIKKWNRKINLVSSRDLDKLYDRHYIDSIAVIEKIPRNARLLDLGSGNGFPSVPIAVLRPDVLVTALEIRKKKIFFLENVKKKLTLQNYKTLNLAAETSPLELESYFDVITARAFMDKETVLNKARFYGKNGAKLYYYNSLSLKQLKKGGGPEDEVVHNVNKIVYKLRTGEHGLIYEIEIRK
jgi:16S rRNA (guanine527-N7)-methyltransferase